MGVVTAAEDSPPNTDPTPRWRRMRYVTTFMLTMAATVAFCMRVTLSIAIVAMTSNTTNPDYTTFDWDLSTQSTALSSFFWGYVVTNLPSAILIARYGARWLLLTSMVTCSVATYVIPVVCEVGGWQALCALRVLQGFTQGCVFPAITAVIGKWAPADERGRLGSIALTGIQMGSIITLPVSGELAGGAGGWPSIFYTFASVGMAWCLLWFFIGYDTPSEHPFITKSEKDYIESFYTNQQTQRSFRTPWRHILTSMPVWSVLISHCVFTWGFYMLLSEMPTYMHHVLKFNIKDNGALACLPYIVMLVLVFAFGWLSDVLVSRGALALVTARKLFNTIGFFGPMATMIGLSYVGLQQKTLAVVLLVLSAGLNAGVFLGFQVSHLDMSPRFAGITMGITNGVGNCISMIVPLVTGAIVTNEESEDEWHVMFWITAGVYLLGTIVFIMFGSAETQPWNEAESAENVEAISNDTKNDVKPVS